MGDKAAARQLARDLGVPTVPGYDGADQSDAALRRAAKRIGYPLLVKPAAGGGGKGMRTVREAARLNDALASARREAIAAFDDDRLILERFVEGPRHVEVQVLFDAHGTGVHLGERDCSTQRRHQKVLEETPSPAVKPKVRAQLTQHALRLAGAVGYRSAGTCEFLLTDRGEVFFLEMNTRLQVEHPVTELVTGVDLVEQQLRVAEGRPLDLDQAAIDDALARRRPRDRGAPVRRGRGGRLPAGDGSRRAAALARWRRASASTPGSTRVRPSALASTRCSPRSSPTGRIARRRSIG